MSAHHEAGQNWSAWGPTCQDEELGIDGSDSGSSLPLIFLLSPCLQFRVVTSAHDRKQNIAALCEHEQSCELLVFKYTSERKCSQ